VKDTTEHLSVDWSVIVIARNEEKSIADCLHSVVEAFSTVNHEVIFVDSASEDKTVEIARQFPVKVIRLPDSLPKRPSIAREAGRLQANGQWILFLDGDSTLSSDWLPKAEQAQQSDDKLAGIAGEREEMILTETNKKSDTWKYEYPVSDYESANFLGGSAAYKNNMLKKVGGFNPFLYSSEEEEFGARIRKAGYTLKRLPVTMTRHQVKHRRETVSEILRRINRGFPIGMGQIIRHVQHYQLPIKGSLKTISRHLQFYALMIIGLITFTISMVTSNWLIFSGWLIFLLTIFILFCIKTRSITKPAYYFFEWATTGPFVIWGLLKTPRQWSDFDKQLLEIKAENSPL
jgi:glycosyltransferase involved in cell wall biosynthesis